MRKSIEKDILYLLKLIWISLITILINTSEEEYLWKQVQVNHIFIFSMNTEWHMELWESWSLTRGISRLQATKLISTILVVCLIQTFLESLQISPSWDSGKQTGSSASTSIRAKFMQALCETPPSKIWDIYWKYSDFIGRTENWNVILIYLIGTFKWGKLITFMLKEAKVCEFFFPGNLTFFFFNNEISWVSFVYHYKYCFCYFDF